MGVCEEVSEKKTVCEVRMMRFNYTYKITYASGQCYDRWKSQLNIEVTEEQYRKNSA